MFSFPGNGAPGTSPNRQLPPLSESAQQFLIAAYYAAIDSDLQTRTGTIRSLQWLFTNSHLSPQGSEYLIIHLLLLEQISGYKIKNRSTVMAFLASHGVQVDLLLFAPDTSVEILSAISAVDNTFVTRTRNGCTALHRAVIDTLHFGWETKIKFLLDQGVDTNALATLEGGVGTALHILIANEDFNNQRRFARANYLITELARRGGFDWNLRDSQGKTPLIIAAKMCASMLVELLLVQRATYELQMDLNAQDSQGRTALHFCCALGDLNSVRLLVKAGASLKVSDNDKKTPFDYCQLPEAEIRIFLEEIHIDPDRDENALHNFFIGVSYKPVTVGETNTPVKAIKSEVDAILPHILSLIAKGKYSDEALRAYDLAFMEIQARLTGRSLIETCLKGHMAVREFLTTRQQVKVLIKSLKSAFVCNPKPPLPFVELISALKLSLTENPSHTDILTALQQNDISLALRKACAHGNDEATAALITYINTVFYKDTCNRILFENKSPNGYSAFDWAEFHAHKTLDMRIFQLFINSADAQPLNGLTGLQQRTLEEFMAVRAAPTNPTRGPT